MVTSDFNGDGKSDILWHHDNGQVAIWELNGTTVIGGGLVGNPGPSWEVIATGDFYGDGHSDILWQNDSGEVAIWELNGTSVIASASLGNPGPSWHAVATGDFNGDGTSDILFQNSNGEIAIWGMSGGKWPGPSMSATPDRAGTPLPPAISPAAENPTSSSRTIAAKSSFG